MPNTARPTRQTNRMTPIEIPAMTSVDNCAPFAIFSLVGGGWGPAFGCCADGSREAIGTVETIDIVTFPMSGSALEIASAIWEVEFVALVDENAVSKLPMDSPVKVTITLYVARFKRDIPLPESRMSSRAHPTGSAMDFLRDTLSEAFRGLGTEISKILTSASGASAGAATGRAIGAAAAGASIGMATGAATGGATGREAGAAA
jgi:hypothetical protein